MADWTSLPRVGPMTEPLTVLVTGATGFIGRRLVPELVERGMNVRAMTRRPESYDGPGEPVGGDVHAGQRRGQ